VIVRIEPEAAASRGRRRLEAGTENGADRFEGRGVEFQRHVAAVYDELADRHPERIAVVDGSGSPEDVHGEILGVVERRR
jgi:dTMP kinase